MAGVKITGTSMVGGEIWSNDITGMILNGVEVAPLVEAELDGRHPERRNLFAAVDAAAVRDAWADVESLWDRTLKRALRYPDADEAFAARRARVDAIGTYIRRIDDKELQRQIRPKPSRGDPNESGETVLRRVRTLLREEWLHMYFADRDLTKLESA